MIKVVILDIDGTLINSNKEITKKTKDALLKLQENNIKLVIASGRPTSGIIKYGKELLIDKNNGFYISFNGSKFVEASTMNELYDKQIDKEIVKNLVKHLDKFNVKTMIHNNDYLLVNDVYDCMIDNDGDYLNVIQFESKITNKKLKEVNLVEYVDFPVNKVLVSSDAKYLRENYKEIKEPFKDILNCMFTANFYFEFTDKNIDKGSAIENILIPMGYKKEEIMAFGDGENDINMIKLAHIGIAMGNAIESLKEVSDYITESNENDGIALALYKFFPEIFK